MSRTLVIGSADMGLVVAAALSVTRAGAQPSMATRAEIEDLLRR